MIVGLRDEVRAAVIEDGASYTHIAVILIGITHKRVLLQPLEEFLVKVEQTHVVYPERVHLIIETPLYGSRIAV